MSEMNDRDELRELEKRRAELKRNREAQSAPGIELAYDLNDWDQRHARNYIRIALALANPTACKWTHKKHLKAHDTTCGRFYKFNKGGPIENKFTHCPYCGHPIEAIDTDGTTHEPPEGLK